MIDYHKEKIETDQQLRELLVKFKQKELCWFMLFIEKERFKKEKIHNWEKWCDLGLQYMQSKKIADWEFRKLLTYHGIDYIENWNNIKWFYNKLEYADISRIFTAKTYYTNKNWNNFIHD